ncbi:hypothetical protein LCGC14_2611130, partial [marine sediment metagenome]
GYLRLHLVHGGSLTPPVKVDHGGIALPLPGNLLHQLILKPGAPAVRAYQVAAVS